MIKIKNNYKRVLKVQSQVHWRVRLLSWAVSCAMFAVLLRVRVVLLCSAKLLLLLRYSQYGLTLGAGSLLDMCLFGLWL